MKITERRLRLIIRETLLEEQNRIDEGNTTLDAIKAAAFALGLTLSAHQLDTFYKYVSDGNIGQTVVQPLSGGSLVQQNSHNMTKDEEAQIDEFIKNPSINKVPAMTVLLQRVNMSFGAGRQGTTPGGDPYKKKIEAANKVIKYLIKNNKGAKVSAMSSL